MSILINFILVYNGIEPMNDFQGIVIDTTSIFLIVMFLIRKHLVKIGEKIL